MVYENQNLYWKAVDGSNPSEQLVKSDHRQFPASFSPDGKTLIFVQTETAASHDIGALSLNGDRQPRPVVQTSANEEYPSLSPDGRWPAYTSDESGRNEVYFQSYLGPGGKEQISNGAGRMVEVWKARETRLDRIVAIKKVREQYSSESAGRIAGSGSESLCRAAYLARKQPTVSAKYAQTGDSHAKPCI